MKKIFWMRRIGYSFSLVGMGILITGDLPKWLAVIGPTVAIAWLIFYDEFVNDLKKGG